MLKHSYEAYSKNHNNEQSLSLAVEDLRKLARWLLHRSCLTYMPIDFYQKTLIC